jgi:hypothetical protein
MKYCKSVLGERRDPSRLPESSSALPSLLVERMVVVETGERSSHR